MASSSVSQEDHDVEHDFAMASRRAKVRSARANRTVNNYPNSRGDGELEKELLDSNEPNSLVDRRSEQSGPAIVLLEQNDASPKLVCRGIPKDKRSVGRGAHAGKSNKGARDRRKLREKRRSTGVMHLPSTESTGGSTGEDENIENSMPPSLPTGSGITRAPALTTATGGVNVLPGDSEVDKVLVQGQTQGVGIGNDKTFDKVECKQQQQQQQQQQGKSESDLDADDEANNSGDVRGNGNGLQESENWQLKGENERLLRLLTTKDKRITALELQVVQLTRQMSEIREENAKLLRVFNQSKIMSPNTSGSPNGNGNGGSP